MSELFRIKPLEWEWFETAFYQGWRTATPIYKAEVSRGRPRGSTGEWANWEYYTKGVNQGVCVSPEEGKQLAEEHWQEYIRQALVPVETQQ